MRVSVSTVAVRFVIIFVAALPIMHVFFGVIFIAAEFFVCMLVWDTFVAVVFALCIYAWDMVAATMQRALVVVLFWHFYPLFVLDA